MPGVGRVGDDDTIRDARALLLGRQRPADEQQVGRVQILAVGLDLADEAVAPVLRVLAFVQDDPSVLEPLIRAVANDLDDVTALALSGDLIVGKGLGQILGDVGFIDPAYPGAFRP